MKAQKAQKEKSLFRILFSGVFRYVIFSILISLFFENTLFWTFLNTAGVTAWVMHRIANSGRIVLPMRLLLKKIWYQLTGKQFDKENTKEKAQWEKIQAYELQRIENPFNFRKIAWSSLLPPVIGSLMLQVMYFSSLEDPVPAGLLAVWVLSNILLTLFFAGIGAGVMRGVFLLAEHDDRQKHSNHKKKTDTQWIDRLVAIAILATYLSLNVLPAVIPVHAADCSKKKQTIDEFMECYDKEKDYQPHTEPIVTWYDVNGVPINQGGSHGGEDGSAEEYELAYYNQPEKELNLVEAAWKGISAMQRDLAGIVKRDGGNALKYLEQNWNNPGKLISDYGKVRAEYNKAYQQGLVEAAAAKGKGATGIMDSIGKWFQGEWNQLSKAPLSYIRTSTMEIAGWYDTKVVQPAVSHVQNVAAAIVQNPLEILNLGNILLAPAAHIKVAIQNNYPGGTKQLYTDTAAVLADKETYWNILKSPYSETTQKLFEEGKYVQASGRASAEASVEGAQEAGENLLSFGTAKIGKVGVFMLGFAVDASKYGGKAINVVEDVGDYSRLPRRLLPDVHIANSSYRIEADTTRFSEGALQHVFDGSATKNTSGGIRIGGFHHEGENTFGKVTKVLKEDTKTGVYEAEVEIFDYQKNTHIKAISTFFPKSWSKEDVVKAINEVYQAENNLNLISKTNLFYEKIVNGVKIRVIVDKNSKKIITSYPLL